MTPASRPSASRAHPGTLLRATLELGLPSMLLYLQHQAGLRTGWIRRRTPIFGWDERPLRSWLRESVPAEPEAYVTYRARGARFFFDPAADLRPALTAALASSAPALIEEAWGILDGRFRLFGGPIVRLGIPPDWHAFAPIAGGESAGRLEGGKHWSAYDELRAAADIKLLWEPSRFTWAFTLGRAYRLTTDARFAEGFWALLDSWRNANRPNEGPHWISAQEVALRILALTFALYAFGPWLDPARAATIAETTAAHAARLPATLAYSRSLGNNHLVSEAAGLYTAGLLFPEFRDADRWRVRGRRLLTRALPRQFHPDGGQIQHSLNYHRLVLQAGLWCARLAEINGEPFPPQTIDSLRRGAQYLIALADRETGAAPNFGANDGAQILPLTTCAFSDYRPTLHLASATIASPPQPDGPWQEAAVWFGWTRPEVDRIAAPAAPRDFPDSGLHLLSGGHSSALLRATHFKTRPSHADQLHIDLRWRGHEIVCDAGSFLYIAPPPWDNGLALAAAHNTLRLDGEEPMRRAGPFLWLDWAQARFIGRWASPGGMLEVLAAEHTGYRRIGAIHRRTLARAGDDLWLVVDDLIGTGGHTATLAWLMPDDPAAILEANSQGLHLSGLGASVRLEAAAPGARVRRALYRQGRMIAGDVLRHPSPVWGWRSPTYAVREPALSFAAEISGALPLRLMSWFMFAGVRRASLQAAWAFPGQGMCALRSLAYNGDTLQVGSGPRVLQSP